MTRLCPCPPRRPQWWTVRLVPLFLFVILLYSLLHNNNPSPVVGLDGDRTKHPKNIHIDQASEHSLCILIPFRDRFEELTEFVPRITEFLKRQNLNPKIVVINQVLLQSILWIEVDE